MITAEILRKIAPNAPKDVDKFVKPLNETIQRYAIIPGRRTAMFLAQLAHESDEFKAVKEYASGKAYEGRKDLGNVRPGDGMRFKGRGLIQTTGRANYAALTKAFGIDFVAFPEKLEEPHWAAMTAGYYWSQKKLNVYADLPPEWRSPTKRYSPFEMVTYLINGGQNGIEHRKALYKRAKAAFGIVDAA